MNAHAFLRWAAVNVLLGSWDNYYATPSNYYLYNSGRPGAGDDFMRRPYFTFIPWDYDNCLGIDYFGTEWQYTDILDWPANTRRNGSPDRPDSRIPLVHNLLRNRDYRQYYLDYLEYPARHPVQPRGVRRADRARIRQRAVEPGIARPPTSSRPRPNGQPFTGRQFTNDEVYRSGWKQYELRHGKEKAEGIIHYVRMRHDSARQQLEQLRGPRPGPTAARASRPRLEPLPRRRDRDKAGR